MSDEHNRGAHEDHPHRGSEPPAPIKPHQDKPAVININAEIINVDAKNAAIHEPESNSHVGDETKKPKTPAERHMIWITAIIAVLTAVNICVFWYESEDTSAKLTTLSGKAEEIVGSINAALSDNRDALKKAFDANRSALESSEKQSKASLEASIKASRSDQRAWLGAGDQTYTIAETGPIESTAVILNIGKSPATTIVCRTTGTTKPKGYILKESDIIYPSDLPIIREGTIFPNQHFPLKTSNGPPQKPMEPNRQKIWFDNVQNGDWVQYFYGEVRYTDAFGRNHWTHFCSQFVPVTKSGTPCPVYTDTDETKK